ncbi:hypothetical protein X975_09044, partial [Stegodyphus mimosarum]
MYPRWKRTLDGDMERWELHLWGMKRFPAVLLAYLSLGQRLVAVHAFCFSSAICARRNFKNEMPMQKTPQHSRCTSYRQPRGEVFPTKQSVKNHQT